MTEIIMQAYQVLDEMIADSVYKELKLYKQIINKKYEDEIKAFQLIKDQYDQMMSEGGSYHPDFTKTNQKLSEMKSKVYHIPEIKHYFELEKAFQEKLNAFLCELTQSVSPYIQIPNQIGIVTKGGSCHVR